MRVIDEDVWGAINIFAEARGEPYEGQVAVGNVVRNRIRLLYASDGTVVGTIWRPLQFSWTLGSDKQRVRVLAVDDEDPRWQRAFDAWKESATNRLVPDDTVLYHAEYVKPGWAKTDRVELVAQIGAHLFYREL